MIHGRKESPKDNASNALPEGDGGMSKAQFASRYTWRILAIIVLISGLMLIKPAPAHALSIDEYFTYSYTIQLSQTEVYRDETFSAIVSGQAVCIKKLPFGITPSSASVISRITARHNTTGDEIVLNPEYTISIDSFPGTPGDYAQETVVVPLTFPYDSESGTYTVTGEIITAKVRVLTFWMDVTKYIPTSQILGNVTCFTRYISKTGEFLMKYTAKSNDNKAAATFQPGTIGLTQHGQPLSEITVAERQNPPSPPADAEAIGLTYDFGPEGANFDQPVTIRLSYDQTLLPENVAEKNLVIATCDNRLDEWVRLDSNVDTGNNIITAEVTHFSSYTILAYTRPAAIETSNLLISPQEAASGEKITISITVTNTGDLTGIYQIELKINSEVYYARSARLDGGDSVIESFPIYWDTPGTHTIDIAGLSGTFTIEESETALTPSETVDTTTTTQATLTVDVTPVEIADGENTAIRVLVANTSDEADVCRVSLLKDNIRVETKEVPLEAGASREVIFTTLQDTLASYTVELTGPSGVFTIEDMPPAIPEPETPTPQPTATLNWWLVGGIGTLCIIGVLTAFLVIIRRRF
jgi:hypothetical protein